jgi:sugar phosphate isomerase/epimerase
MSVTLAGKCRPEPEALREVRELGFEAIELQLLATHLDAFERSLAAAERSDLDIVSVHTPHLTLEAAEYFSLADAFAAALDATLVVHSKHLQHVHIPEFEALDFDADYAYENNPGCSHYHLENLILSEGHDLVLDTAHLYMAEAAYLGALETLLREHLSSVPVVYLSDSTPRRDGLQFGAGSADLDGTIGLLKRLYEGVVVLEVHPPTAQAEARTRFVEQ